MTFTDIAPALPEIMLALATLALLLFGVLGGDTQKRLVAPLAVGALAIVLGVLHMNAPEGTVVIFNGMFTVDAFSMFAKTVLLIAALAALLMGQGYATRNGLAAFEYPIVILLATLGTLLMVSASDMLALYVGLELQSLALYVLAAFRRDDAKSSEAGLKYFVLGALASGILLFGISLVYGITGTTNFAAIKAGIDAADVSPVLLVGMVFVLAGLAFKISAAPFHMWVPDVYEGSPTSVTAFFAAVPKIAAFALLLRVAFEPFANLQSGWQPIVIAMAVASMVVGGFTALRQTNIKRLLAYSSIGHVGYALVGVAAGGAAGVSAVLLYLAIYCVMTLGVFAVVLHMQRGGRMVETIADLSGLAKTRPQLALVMAALMFSMAGIPPLAGFFGKFYVFVAAINAGLVWLAVVGVLLSAVSAYYYMRIIKVMYFDEPQAALDVEPNRPLTLVLAASVGATVLFIFAPSLVLGPAGAAARSLLG
jgi:NADH-quinone oxidoreductase subunit N